MVKYPADIKHKLERKITSYSEWKDGTIGDLLTIMHGKNQRKVEKINGKYPILGTGGIIGRANKYLCNWECVLIGRKGTIDQPMYMNQPFWSIDTLYFSKPVNDVQCVKYQYYLFCKIPWHEYAESSGRPSLAKKTIESIGIKIPPVKEQKAIADALTAFDTYIEDLTALIAKKKDIRDGALEDLVSGRTRLEGFTGAWKEGKIGDILTIMHGKNQKEVEAFNGKYPILGTGGIIGYTNNFLCNWECVLIGRKGTIDQPMYMDEPFWSIDTLYFSKSVGLKQCVKFQYYLFSTIPWHDYTESSGRPSLAKKVIESIGIKIPSLAEQQAIADTLTAMDEEIQQLEAKRDKMKDIRDGAMDDLLTGRIRLESNV